MSPHTTHPLVDAWLHDLEALLQGVDPGERAEVLAGVREHLDGTLSAAASEEQVRAALAGLGSPQSVADEAYAGRPTPEAAPVPARSPVMARPWVPVVVGVLLGLAGGATVFIAGAMGGYSTTQASGSAQATLPGQQVIAPETTIQYDAFNPVGLVAGLVGTAWLWVPAVLLLLLCPLWTAREKVALTLLTPLAGALVVVLPGIGFALSGKEIGINGGAIGGLALALAGGGLLLVRLCRAASGRATTDRTATATTTAHAA